MNSRTRATAYTPPRSWLEQHVHCWCRHRVLGSGPSMHPYARLQVKLRQSTMLYRRLQRAWRGRSIVVAGESVQPNHRRREGNVLGSVPHFQRPLLVPSEPGDWSCVPPTSDLPVPVRPPGGNYPACPRVPEHNERLPLHSAVPDVQGLCHGAVAAVVSCACCDRALLVS